MGGSGDLFIDEPLVGVEVSGLRDFIFDVVELIDEARVELLLISKGEGRYFVIDIVSCVVSLSSLSLLTVRFIGDERFGFHNGGSTCSDTIPNATSSLVYLVGLRPRCRGVVCVLSSAAVAFKSSIIVKNPSLTPSARRFPAKRI